MIEKSVTSCKISLWYFFSPRCEYFKQLCSSLTPRSTISIWHWVLKPQPRPRTQKLVWGVVTNCEPEPKQLDLYQNIGDTGTLPTLASTPQLTWSPDPFCHTFSAADFSALRFISSKCVVRIGKCLRPLLIKRRCSTFSVQTSGLLTLSAQENMLQGLVLIWEMTIGKSYFRNSLILLNKEVICESYTWGHIKVGEIQIFQQNYMARQIHVERIFDKIQKL